MKTLITVTLALFLASCAGTPQTRADVALAIACDSYATVLDQITPHKAKLSAVAISRIDKTNRALKPACGSDAAMDPSDAVRIVENGIGFLKTVKEDL